MSTRHRATALTPAHGWTGARPHSLLLEFVRTIPPARSDAPVRVPSFYPSASLLMAAPGARQPLVAFDLAKSSLQIDQERRMDQLS
jgi:hypothetical protein